jgi:hypothetical protein
MRVSSLSNDKVIDLLTKYFIPVWVSRDHYQLAAPSDSEQDELLRIDRDRAKRGLEGGTVCVYVLAPDGAVSATMRVQKACGPENLAPFLQKIVDDQKLTPRAGDAVRATTAAVRPAARPVTEGGAVLRIWTRLEDMKNNRGVAQDWVEWTADDWSALAPATDAKPGAAQTVPRETADKVLRRLYPPASRWDVQDSEVTAASLTATVVAVEGGQVRMRLEGDMELKFPVSLPSFNGKVTAHLVGAAHFDTERHCFTSFVLTTDAAEYLRHWDDKPVHQKMLAAVEMAP